MHKTAAHVLTSFWITVNMNTYTGGQMSACKKLFLLAWSREMSPKKQSRTFISKATFSTQKQKTKQKTQTKPKQKSYIDKKKRQ